MDLDRLARTQHGVVSRAQALAHLTPSALRWRLVRGWWWTVHPGTYAVHNGPLDWLGRASAALLHCGEGAALSLGSAAYLLGNRPAASRPCAGRRADRCAAEAPAGGCGSGGGCRSRAYAAEVSR